MLARYAAHFLIDVAASAVTWVAMNHFCSKRWHKAAIWLGGSIVVAVVSVHLVG